MNKIIPGFLELGKWDFTDLKMFGWELFGTVRLVKNECGVTFPYRVCIEFGFQNMPSASALIEKIRKGK